MADEKAEKIKAIELTLTQIEKQFGKGSIMRLGSKEAIVPIAVIPTGSISFDAALGMQCGIGKPLELEQRAGEVDVGDRVARLQGNGGMELQDRFRASAKGRASKIMKPTCHIFVTVGDEEK